MRCVSSRLSTLWFSNTFAHLRWFFSRGSIVSPTLDTVAPFGMATRVSSSRGSQLNSWVFRSSFRRRFRWFLQAQCRTLYVILSKKLKEKHHLNYMYCKFAASIKVKNTRPQLSRQRFLYMYNVHVKIAVKENEKWLTNTRVVKCISSSSHHILLYNYAYRVTNL